MYLSQRQAGIQGSFRVLSLLLLLLSLLFIVWANVVCGDVMSARQALKLGGNQQLMIVSKENSTFGFFRISKFHKVGL